LDNFAVVEQSYAQLLFLTGEKLDVNSPIRSVKCAVVFNMLCKRSQCIVELYPAWPIGSRDMSPSTQGTPLPSACLPTGDLVLQPPRRMNLDGVVYIREWSKPEPAATGQCMCILFFISHLVMLSLEHPSNGLST
jgi:hypothetical protein